MASSHISTLLSNQTQLIPVPQKAAAQQIKAELDKRLEALKAGKPTCKTIINLAKEYLDETLKYNDGYGHSRIRNVPKAVECLQLAITRYNDAWAKYKLGKLYLGKKIIEPGKDNDQIGVELLRQSAEQNCQFGKLFLAECYDFGRGTPIDRSKAFQYYKAAVIDHPTHLLAFANYRLGYCYLHGEGVKKDKLKAYELFKQGMENNGNLDCMLEYAKLIAKGIQQDAKVIVEPKPFEAIEIYKNLLSNPNINKSVHAEINCEIGLIYLKLLEDTRFQSQVTVFLDQTLSYLLKAKSQTDHQAPYHLGHIYENGRGHIKKDLKLAFENYLLAAERNCVDAQFKLGKIFLKGMRHANTSFKVDVNKEAALKWLKKAAEQGIKEAKKMIKENFPAAEFKSAESSESSSIPASPAIPKTQATSQLFSMPERKENLETPVAAPATTEEVHRCFYCAPN